MKFRRILRILLIIGGAAAMVVSIICVGIILWRVPKEQVASLNAKGVKPEDILKAENETHASLIQTTTTLAQIIGGFAVLIGVYFTWKNLTSAKEGQVTDRFYKAIEQLGATDDKGKPKLELRLGGIYALERIARDSERDHWPIMEILIIYVRENGQRKQGPLNPLATDIQAILTVIGRRERSYEKSGQILDLHQVDLHGADLVGAHLESAYLIGTYLEGAYLNDAHLEVAHLEGVHLEGADLTGAHLKGAHLNDVDLSMVRNLAQEQLNSAIGDASTKLPSGLVMPESWKKKASS